MWMVSPTWGGWPPRSLLAAITLHLAGNKAVLHINGSQDCEGPFNRQREIKLCSAKPEVGVFNCSQGLFEITQVTHPDSHRAHNSIMADAHTSSRPSTQHQGVDPPRHPSRTGKKRPAFLPCLSYVSFGQRQSELCFLVTWLPRLRSAASLPGRAHPKERVTGSTGD